MRDGDFRRAPRSRTHPGTARLSKRWVQARRRRRAPENPAVGGIGSEPARNRGNRLFPRGKGCLHLCSPLGAFSRRPTRGQTSMPAALPENGGSSGHRRGLSTPWNPFARTDPVRSTRSGARHGRPALVSRSQTGRQDHSGSMRAGHPGSESALFPRPPSQAPLRVDRIGFTGVNSIPQREKAGPAGGWRWSGFARSWKTTNRWSTRAAGTARQRRREKASGGATATWASGFQPWPWTSSTVAWTGPSGGDSRR